MKESGKKVLNYQYQNLVTGANFSQMLFMLFFFGGGGLYHKQFQTLS